MVLLHGGFGFDSRAWQPQLDGLADEFTVVAWDAPGCGGSDDPPPSFRMAHYADCLAGFLTPLGLRRPHVLGISFGGALALALCARYPKFPGGLILAERTLALMSDIHPEASLTMLRAVAEADPCDVLPTIAVRVLVLHGDLDARAPLSVGQENVTFTSRPRAASTPSSAS